MQIEITSEYLASQGLSPTFAERFWAKVFIVPYDRGCWLWTASCHDFGYGQIGRNGKHSPPIRAHVASWLLHFGPVPAGMYVCHRCDNPPCCNPNHLFLGTHKQNLQDMRLKGRGAKCESHGRRKLTQSQVDQMRAAYVPGETTYESLAKIFGIGGEQVSKIIRNKNWTT